MSGVGHSLHDIMYVYSDAMPQVRYWKKTHPEFDGDRKVIFHANSPCDDTQYVSYDISRINQLFEREAISLNIDEQYLEKLRAKIISLIDGLGKIVKTGDYGAIKSVSADQARAEYPYRYKLFVEGLSDKALDVMKSIDMHQVFTLGSVPQNLGETVAQMIAKDRASLLEAELPTWAKTAHSYDPKAVLAKH